MSRERASRSYVQGTSVSFQGSATDPEDGTLTGASLVWTSSEDGQIGTGTSFTKSNLSVGAHTITLTATDSGALTGTISVSIIVESDPAPPSVSGRIVYSRHSGFDNGDTGHAQWLTVANVPEGTRLVTKDISLGGLSENFWISGKTTPVVSPDGNLVVYGDRSIDPAGFGEYTLKIAEVGADSGQKLGPNADELSMPSFSPSGDRIAAVYHDAGLLQVRVMDTDGSNSKTVFDCSAYNCDDLNISPQAWSPSGTHLFISYRLLENAPQIDMVAVADGTRTPILTGGAWDAAVSVDGWLAFVHDYGTGNGADILLYSPTIGVQTLIGAPSSDHSPVWSGDGSKVAFVSNAAGNADIWVVNRNGGQLLQVTTNPLGDRDPYWVP
jgi:dipeptidyl aminopeptidase/acylaminoacyl peptidase